ncbi:RHS repeat-associated core domain-containing protein, partial [Dehalogenimonas sp. THU2]|uniref:RHS repeat-associated core domain-containing protein n=1 Tax=Dehalogenimonas sp. THU2 TaxID=3151121 RepID=UPI0032181E3B
SGASATATLTAIAPYQTLTWDVENRVVSITGNGADAQYVYDGDGKRVKEIENGETILYVNQYYEKNLTTGVVTTYYYLGGKLIAEREGTTLQYIHQDSLNSTSLVTDSSGGSLGSTTTYPYGATRTGSVPTDEKFTGQRLDSTGLYYYGARYYDPAIGRFISADTIVPDFMNPQAFNRYSYCYNNPLKYTDPTGHWTFLIGAGIGALVGLVKYAIVDMAIQHKEFSWNGFAGTVAGAAVAGAIASTGVGLVGMMAAGAGGNVAGDITEHLFTGDQYGVGDLIKDTIVGGIGGAVANGISGILDDILPACSLEYEIAQGPDQLFNSVIASTMVDLPVNILSESFTDSESFLSQLTRVNKSTYNQWDEMYWEYAWTS